MVPEEVREDLLLFRIGSGRIDWEQVAAAFQHAEAVLHPFPLYCPDGHDAHTLQ